MANDYKPNGGRKLIKKNEYKKTVSGKERYEAYLERDRQMKAMLGEEVEEPEKPAEENETAEKSAAAKDDNKPVSGAARYLAYLERDRQRREAMEAAEAPAENEEEAPAADDETAPQEAATPGEEAPQEPQPKKRAGGESASSGSDENMLRRAFLRRFICSFILAVAAIGLQFARFHVPLTPRLFSIDFSALPELLAAVAYGPIAGIIIVIVKNVIYMLIEHSANITALANVLNDSLFVVLAGFLYTKGYFSRKQRGENAREKRRILNRNRRRNIFMSGLISAVPTTVFSYFITLRVSLPLLYRRYPVADVPGQLLEMYNYSLSRLHHYLPFLLPNLTEITSIPLGTLLFYADVCFAKLMVITLVTMIVYPLASDFMHYRK